MASIPLRYRDEWLGVLMLQRRDPAFDGPTVAQLQLMTDAAAPHLADRHRGDRPLAVHAWHCLRDMAAHLVGPHHVVWKMADRKSTRLNSSH